MPFSCAASSASASWPRNRERFGNRQRPVREAIGKGGALDQLEDQGRRPIDVLEAVDRANVRMIERGEEAGFAREAGTTLGSAVKCDGRILMATSRPSLLSCAR